MAGFIIDGQLEVTIGEQSRVLKAGGAYRFNPIIPHRFRVVGKQPVTKVSGTVPRVF